MKYKERFGINQSCRPLKSNWAHWIIHQGENMQNLVDYAEIKPMEDIKAAIYFIQFDIECFSIYCRRLASQNFGYNTEIY